MPLTSTNKTANTQYTLYEKKWVKMRDVFKGEEHIKDRCLAQNTSHLSGRAELPAITTFGQYIRPTDSMRRLGNLGYQRFCDYVYRADFNEFPLEIQTQSLGLIENEPASFELPAQLDFMKLDATAKNESLEKLLSITNTEQLQVSRVGLLLEPSNEVNKPFNIAVYKTESIRDWHEVTNDDQEIVLDWLKLLTDRVDENDKPIFLILTIEDGVYYQYETINDAEAYGDEPATENGFIPGSLVTPAASENILDEIPFVIANVTRLGVDIEKPFLESVADASLSLFRASAHYEDALYWGGESTLFHKGYGLGEKEQVFVGNGANNGTNAEYADAKYVTMGVDGIEPRKANKDSKFEYCVSLGVDLLNKGTESGVALNIRSNVKTASLKTLALTGALALQTLMKIGAKWISANPEEVIITANTTFADIRYTAEDFVKFASMVDLGAMRELDLYTLQKKHNITSAEEFEEWKSDMKEPVQPPAPINNGSSQKDE